VKSFGAGFKGNVISMRWVGLDKIQQRLLFITRTVSTQLDTMLLWAAMPTLMRAKELCPVKTGALKRSIHAVVIKASVSSGKATVAIGSLQNYALLIELGHSPKAPEGYLRPAVAQTQHIFVDRVVIAMRSALAGIAVGRGISAQAGQAEAP